MPLSLNCQWGLRNERGSGIDPLFRYNNEELLFRCQLEVYSQLFHLAVGLASVVESSILPSWIHVHNFLWIHHIWKLILAAHKDLDLRVLLDNNNRGEGDYNLKINTIYNCVFKWNKNSHCSSFYSIQGSQEIIRTAELLAGVAFYWVSPLTTGKGMRWKFC